MYKKWGIGEFLAASDIAGADAYTPKPAGYSEPSVFFCLVSRCADSHCSERSETIPEHSVMLENAFIITTAAPPLLLHALSYHIFPNWKWGLGFAFFWYHIWFIRFAAKMIRRMHHWVRAIRRASLRRSLTWRTLDGLLWDF